MVVMKVNYFQTGNPKTSRSKSKILLDNRSGFLKYFIPSIVYQYYFPTSSLETSDFAKNKIQIALPPWQLAGSGYILLYHFTKSFIAEHGFLAGFQKEKFESGWGAVMLVDYQTSPVGPYHELLFIPGLFSFNKKKVFSISKIYVSTQSSVVNGIENWGIPKEHADFHWGGKQISEHIDILKDGVSFFQADFIRRRFCFPISTTILPLTIFQAHNERLMLTKPKSSGMAYLTKLQNMKVNSKFFPDLTKVKPLLVLRVDNFKMEFPVPIHQSFQK